MLLEEKSLKSIKIPDIFPIIFKHWKEQDPFIVAKLIYHQVAQNVGVSNNFASPIPSIRK